jgi:hypothetical protein
MSEQVNPMPWCFHKIDSCDDVWDQVILKVTPHISTWDDPIGQYVMAVDSPVVSITDWQSLNFVSVCR